MSKHERKWKAQGFDLSNQPRGLSSPCPWCLLASFAQKQTSPVVSSSTEQFSLPGRE